MDTFNRRQVFGNSPSGMSPPCNRCLHTRYELLASLGEYVSTVTRRRFDDRALVDRFEFQGDLLLVRVEPLDARGIMRWLATDGALDILRRVGLDRIAIVQDSSLVPLQI